MARNARKSLPGAIPAAAVAARRRRWWLRPSLRRRADAAPPALPIDVRAMRAIATLAFAFAAAMIAAAAFGWVSRQPLFDIRRIVVQGDLQRNDEDSLRAVVMPRLAGNFFTLDLQAARAVFESVPWVRHAVVRRYWPNLLVVRLEEQHPVALWQGEDADDRLVNAQGEVFEASATEVEDDDLPTLSGPPGSSTQVLAMYRLLKPALAPMATTIDALRLSARGSWRAELGSGAAIELGRGGDAEVIARAERFVRTLPQLADRMHRPLLYADLRHAEGYAVRLKGVTTTTAAAPSAPAATAQAAHHH